jgi:hypothetical protein
LEVVMVASRGSVGRALRVLESTVPWSNKTAIPSVSTTVAFALTQSGRLEILALDEANDRRHSFELADVPRHPDHAVKGAIEAIHAPFN